MCLGPFNYPLNETFVRCCPPVEGNTASSGQVRFADTPLLSAFAESFPGVVNIIFGRADLASPIMQTGHIEFRFDWQQQVKQRSSANTLSPTAASGAGASKKRNFSDAGHRLAVKECVKGA